MESTNTSIRWFYVRNLTRSIPTVFTECRMIKHNDYWFYTNDIVFFNCWDKAKHECLKINWLWIWPMYYWVFAGCRRRGRQGYWGCSAVHSNTTGVQWLVVQLRYHPIPTARHLLRLRRLTGEDNWMTFCTRYGHVIWQIKRCGTIGRVLSVLFLCWHGPSISSSSSFNFVDTQLYTETRQCQCSPEMYFYH